MNRILVISKSAFLVKGFINCMHIIGSKYKIDNKDTFDNINASYDFLVVDQWSVLHLEPLKRLLAKTGNSNNLLICRDNNSSSVETYFKNIIYEDEPENMIIEKLKEIFETPDMSEVDTDTKLLSDREEEIVRNVASGLTNKEIADKLFISTHTVITHRKNISAKLGIKTIAGLTIYAVLNGLIEESDLQNP